MMDITPIEQQLRRAMTPSPCFASDWGPVFGPRIPHRFVMPMVGKQRGAGGGKAQRVRTEKAMEGKARKRKRQTRTTATKIKGDPKRHKRRRRCEKNILRKTQQELQKSS
jgi:hypothetical protein